MAEYFANAVQAVDLNQPVLFDASIPCTKGYIYHEDGTGIFILRGITNNCFARYQVTFNGNISIPEGGAVSPISLLQLLISMVMLPVQLLLRFLEDVASRCQYVTLAV